MQADRVWVVWYDHLDRAPRTLYCWFTGRLSDQCNHRGGNHECQQLGASVVIFLIYDAPRLGGY